MWEEEGTEDDDRARESADVGTEKWGTNYVLGQGLSGPSTDLHEEREYLDGACVSVIEQGLRSKEREKEKNWQNKSG